jgi:hypothetical protein
MPRSFRREQDLNPRLATDDRSEVPAGVDYRAGAAIYSLCLTVPFTLLLVGIFTIYTPDRLILAMLGESLKGSEWLHLAGIGMFLGLVFLFGGASWLTLNRLFARLARAPR